MELKFLADSQEGINSVHTDTPPKDYLVGFLIQQKTQVRASAMLATRMLKAKIWADMAEAESAVAAWAATSEGEDAIRALCRKWDGMDSE